MYEFTINNQTLKLTVVVNGEKVWFDYGTGAQEKEAATEEWLSLLHAMNQWWIASLTPLLDDPSFTLSTTKGKDVNKKPTVGVKVTSGKQPATLLYFDKETGLLVKQETMVNDPPPKGKEVLDEMYYSDYKEIGGRKFYTQWKWNRDGKTMFAGTFSDQKVVDKLDPKLFEKP